MPTVHLTIKGKVQGVFYRATAKDKATALGLKGWVKNSPDNSVEIVAQGPDEQVQHLIAWCKQGPSHARVDEVITETIADQQFDEFIILR